MGIVEFDIKEGSNDAIRATIHEQVRNEKAIAETLRIMIAELEGRLEEPRLRAWWNAIERLVIERRLDEARRDARRMAMLLADSERLQAEVDTKMR